VLTSSEGGSYKTLRKTPPYTLEISGSIESDPNEEKCTEAYWDWGDGTRDTVPCQDDPGALYKGRHTYTRVGVYGVTLAMTTTASQGTYSDMQKVIMGSTFPNTTPLHDAARWVLWAGSLGVMLALLRWLRRRRTGWARLGFWLTLLALFTYLPPFSYFPNPLGIPASFQSRILSTERSQTLEECITPRTSIQYEPRTAHIKGLPLVERAGIVA
jgi:hypothetical protein